MPTNPASYTRDWRRRNPERVRLYARAVDPEKRRARDRLNAAVRSGQIVRPETCEVCGRAPGRDFRGRSLVQGHHPDHGEPFAVVWVDPRCHAALGAA